MRQEKQMRTYYDIDLNERSIRTKELHGEEIVRAGRYLIAKTLVEMNAASVDPAGTRQPA
jgi:aldehyde:ferredoxin oxidoreductase